MSGQPPIATCRRTGDDQAHNDQADNDQDGLMPEAHPTASVSIDAPIETV